MLMMDDIHRSSAAESFRFAIVACNSSTADDGATEMLAVIVSARKNADL